MKNFVGNATTQNRPTRPAHIALAAKLMSSAAAVCLSWAALPAFAQNVPISPAYLTGVWQDNPQCQSHESTTFFPNNTMSSAGSVPAQYTVTGPSQFTLHGPGGVVSIQAQYVNQNLMLITLNNSSTTLYRCGATHAFPGHHAPGHNAQLSPAYLVGGWGFNGNCNINEVFSPNGQMRTSNNDWGRWNLIGNQLHLTIANGNSLVYTVQPMGPHNIQLTQNNNGQIVNYKRCF